MRPTSGDSVCKATSVGTLAASRCGAERRGLAGAVANGEAGRGASAESRFRADMQSMSQTVAWVEATEEASGRQLRRFAPQVRSPRIGTNSSFSPPSPFFVLP